MGKRVRDYLSVVFAIYKRDLLNIVRNPIALILILGACALPSAYAWFTTAANWDPYQNTQNIRIAVANDDTGTSSAETGAINIGEKVVDELRQNKELGWTFYDSSEEAINSVYEGKCYAAIIFPADFSKDFASILSGDFQQPKIDYYINEKISASAPDFTNEGANVIQEDIDQSFVNTVTTTVLNITQKIGRNLIDKGDASETALASGVRRASDALKNTREALQEVGPAIDSMVDASAKANETLGHLHDSIPTMKSILEQARTDLEGTRTAAEKYGEQLQNALNQSAVDLGKTASMASTSLAMASADATKVYGATSSALTQAQSIIEQNGAIISDLESQISANPALANQLKPYIDNLKKENDQIKSTADALSKANDALYASLQSVDSMLTTINDQAQQGANDIASASTQLRNQISPAFNSSLDSYADALGALSGIVLALEPAVDQAQATLSDLDDALSQSKDAASNADASLDAIQTRLSNTLTDINAIQSSSTVRELDEYLKVDASKTASFISAPVKLETVNVYPVKNYGSGVVAFFSSVAMWVAGFVLIDLLKMRVNPAGLPRFTKGQAYWGRWLLFTTLGVISPIIICAGDLIMGIQSISPPAFIFAGIVSGIVYTNLIYALAHAFRYIGKALAVLLLILQIPGSSGLYPIEMMPGFYQFIHPLLPFTYTIDAFREAIGGFYGMHYLIDLCVLFFAFMPIGFFTGLILGRWASNLTLLLDRDIGKTGLFDGEDVPKNLRLRLGTLVEALLHAPEYRARLAERVKHFNERFPRLRTAGWILLAAQFLITFALMIVIKADVDMKLILLAAMVIGVLVVDAYLITIAYMRANLDSKLSLLDRPDSELPDEIRQSLDNQGDV